MFKNQYKNQIIIASALIILSVTGFLFGRTDYYFLEDRLGYVEVPKQYYLNNKSDSELSSRFKRKHSFNLLIGLLSTSISLLVWITLQSKVSLWNINIKTLRLKTLKDFAEHYYNLGFNLTIINGLSKNNNSYQDSFKIPLNDWESFRKVRQTKDEITAFDWENATGIGAITGVNELICIDIDGCNDLEFIKGFLFALNLPADYNWVVKSGSHTGFHIWVKASTSFPSSIPYPPNNTLYYFPLKDYRVLFKQIELRLSDHIVLPPSKNRDGNYYVYINDTPLTPPDEIEIKKLIHTIEKVSYCKNSYEYQVTTERRAMSILFILFESDNGIYKVNYCTTNQYGGVTSSIPEPVLLKSPSQLFDQHINGGICRAINQSDLLILFESENHIKEFIRVLTANSLISYNKPVFQVNELIKQHYLKGFSGILDLYQCLFPFGDFHQQRQIKHLDLFVKVFFKLANHFQNLRFKFKQYLNLDASFFKIEIPNIMNDQTEAVYLAQQHEFILTFKLNSNETGKGPSVRTILPNEIISDIDNKIILSGFCYSDCKTHLFDLEYVSDLILNPQFIDYSDY